MRKPMRRIESDLRILDPIQNPKICNPNRNYKRPRRVVVGHFTELALVTLRSYTGGYGAPPSTGVHSGANIDNELFNYTFRSGNLQHLNHRTGIYFKTSLIQRDNSFIWEKLMIEPTDERVYSDIYQDNNRGMRNKILDIMSFNNLI